MKAFQFFLIAATVILFESQVKAQTGAQPGAQPLETPAAAASTAPTTGTPPAAPVAPPSEPLPPLPGGIEVRGTGGSAKASQTDSAVDTATPPVDTSNSATVPTETSSGTPSVAPSVTTSGTAVPSAPAAGSAVVSEASSEEMNNLIGSVPPQVWSAVQEVNYRQLPGIRWPSPFLAASAIREKYKDIWSVRDVSQFKEIFSEYCLSYAQLFQAELETQWQLQKGLLRLPLLCEELQLVVSTATAQDDYLFEYPNPLVIRKMDQAAYQVYVSALQGINDKLSNITQVAADVAAPVVVNQEADEDASLLKGLGLPAGLVPLLVELLLLLSLVLNFFLLYKVLKK